MSIEMAGTFIKKLDTDSALQRKLELLGKVDAAAMAKFADGEGYKFSASELNQSLAALELDEKSLDRVVGGADFNPQPEPPGKFFITRFLNINAIHY